MLLLIVGLAIVSIPIALALRTVLRLSRGLGSVDAAAIADVLTAEPSLDLARLRSALSRQAKGSIAHRLIEAALEADAREGSDLAKKLVLAEVVSDIERDVSEDARTPRVAASLATTGGLLAATIVMREGLGRLHPAADGTFDPSAIFQDVVERGLALGAIAVFGGIVCATLHRSALQLRRERLRELDALIEPLVARYPRAEDPL